MKNIFEKLGYTVSEDRSSVYTIEVKLLCINNRDKSIRWVWPVTLRKPLFLKFYNSSNLKSGLFFIFAKAIFFLRLQRFVFNRKSIFIEESKKNEFEKNFQSWALFTGTVGINNKGILYRKVNGVGTFTKIATTPNASELLKKESYFLERLYASHIQNFVFPDTLSITENTIELSDISNKGFRNSSYTGLHTAALTELNEISSFLSPLNELENWKEIKSDLVQLSKLTDTRIPKGMLKKLNTIVNNLNEFSSIEVSLSHGDFTPWNMFEKDLKLHIYDWELSDPLKPLGFDAFHFVIQQGILVDRKSWREIKKEILNKLNGATFTCLSKFNTGTLEQYLQLYLLFNCINYLKIYSKQKKWHPQVYWLIDTWNEAISEFSIGWETHRELILLDTFDFLQKENYAAIKFPNLLPERLSKFSDVDLCIEKSVNSKLFNYLLKHPLVNKIKSVNKSFMANHQVICTDGSILSLDLIWNVKRKEMVMLDAKELLSKLYINPYGIKTLDLIDNVRYIGLFYGLNGFHIPQKYKVYGELLANSQQPLDMLLLPFFINDDGNRPEPLKNFLKRKRENQGANLFRNKVLYLFDTARSFFNFSGMIITFSGVDGAGKSTIIEKVKLRLEKQLRKRVIVLRHRPSMLPILSAWTKGKAQAESDSASTLPRQGNNKNQLSSLFRFSYYYLDYLIGQFVIYFKYVSRGYVVLYDRYYYDFINDSKRSNIILPSGLIKRAFSFIMKPNFNYFLYAQPEVILSRKKELDSKTIEELTTKYIKLFQDLKKDNKDHHFKSIENIEMESTVNTILNDVSKKAA